MFGRDNAAITTRRAEGIMSVYVTGDLHGNVAEVRERLAQIPAPTEDDYIIVAGDAGLEYGGQIMGSVKKVMKKFPGKWIIVRGNHDTRYWRDHWDSWLVTEDGNFLYQKKYPNILYVRDGGQISDIGGYTILFVPGAFSIDKEYRIKRNLLYEYEEQLTESEIANLKLLAENYQIDFIIGHTYPIGIEPFLRYLFLDNIKQSSVDKTMEYAIEDILNQNTTWKHYFFGHMHDDKLNILNKYSLLYHKVINLQDYEVSNEI